MTVGTVLTVFTVVTAVTVVKFVMKEKTVVIQKTLRHFLMKFVLWCLKVLMKKIKQLKKIIEHFLWWNYKWGGRNVRRKKIENKNKNMGISLCDESNFVTKKEFTK